jgi:hypothetical protein
MSAVQVNGVVDEQHRLIADVPPEVAPGPVRVIIVPADSEDAENQAWLSLIDQSWSEWLDPREDIYTIEDGMPVDGPR